MALKHRMKVKQPSTGSTAAQARLERELARLVADGDQLWAELQETSEEYQARVARGAPVQRTLARYNRLGARHDALAASIPYVEMGAMERGMKLFSLWEHQTRDLAPGKEYDLVDAFAAELRLQGWFAWVNDIGELALAHGPEGASNPELLAIKSPAAVFYFLEILKNFDAMDPETIKHVVAEAAGTGRGGLNYGSPDKSYRVPAYEPESLSGLDVMCIMYAAFQRVAPQEDIEIDLHDAYQKALAMHEAQKRAGG